MAEKIFLQTFLLGVVLSEWIEITKVSNADTKSIASYGSTPSRPQMNKIASNNNRTDEFANETNPYHVNDETGADDITVEDATYSTEYFDVEAENFTQNRRISDGGDFIEYDDDYYYYEDDDGVDEKEDEPVDSTGAFMSVIKNIQSQLLDFKGKSLEAKIEHLKKLRDNILYEIKYRISNLFKTPKDSEPPDSRLYKNNNYYSDEHHHMMGYPSHEGALMTIGFLTFAVFLVKLVLKLIYTLKMKQHYYYNQTTRPTTPVSIFLKRSEREIEQDEATVRILRYLDEYHSKS